MKKASEHSDSSRKKLVGEYLRNADKLLKSGEYEEALSEVEKSLELEPGNFYAQAYKERITALREKHSRPGELRPAAPSGAAPAKSGAPPAPQRPAAGEPPADSPPGEDLTEIAGARIEEIPSGEIPSSEPTDVADLRDQLERERATHESETRRQTEEIALAALEAELRQREEAERLKAAEQQALDQAAEEGRAEARREIVDRAKAAFGKMLAGGDTEGAFAELAKIRIVDPADADLADLEVRLDAAASASVTPPAVELNPLPREISLQWFGKILRSAWGEGQPNPAQAEAVSAARKRFGVSEEEENSLLPGIQREIMAEALKSAYAAGEPDPESMSFLETLGRELSVGDIENLKPKPTK